MPAHGTLAEDLLGVLCKYISPHFASGGEDLFVVRHTNAAAHSYLIAGLRSSFPKKTIWILHDQARSLERLGVELLTWKCEAVSLPDASDTDDLTAAEPETEAMRMQVFHSLTQTTSRVILCHEATLLSKAPSRDELGKSRIVLQIGSTLDPQDLTRQLVDAGYESQPIVHSRGQFCQRGGIIDLFPWHAPQPLRIEFFDREIESIREFDADSQLSIRKRDQVNLLLQEPAKSGLVADWIKPDHLIIYIGENPPPHPRPHVHISPDVADVNEPNQLSLIAHTQPLGGFEAGDFILQENKRQRFFSQLAEWRNAGWTIAMVFANNGEETRFRELVDDSADILPLRGELHAGFTIPAIRIAVLSSAELFGRYRTVTNSRRSLLDRHNAAHQSLEEIQLADLVVHAEYGIGRFRGIQPSDDGHGEEILIEYLDGALLSVPIEQAHLVAKYIGMGGKTPDLTKLGGTSWKNTRKTAEKSILDYAAQILSVQAERQAKTGYAHPPDTKWMWEFENSFHYTETADQKRAIDETKRDMERPEPMDRLICGDVGFGKTEVAIRAAFKCATGGKQVALLCPTTVLAEQHWRTFRERMSDYPIRIDLLNRFRTPAEVRNTVAGLASGAVDIVIGTHRLLSNDISYRDLGLVVVDEEQRFGVKHKEKFKEIFRHIDVLTLSATPIPRTLYMALMGTRDMSTIDTPPPNRIPVHTTIAGYDERIIRDAIRREMRRGGQVFFLHNRVKTIESMRGKIQALIPEARILVGHGQMEQDELEGVMKKFVNGEADILLATTIIETGIDIPNANTILIDRADRFGLADLYQLRGRVGRAGEQAYAILLLPRDMMAQGDARKRIQAIRQYTALGSGFKIAMRDLEIRGAGNLLGTKQSGHIAAVGFDLYCKLLRQSIDRLRGRPATTRSDCTLRLDFIATSTNDSNETNIQALIPNDFLPDIKLRVNAWRELAECLTEKDLAKLQSAWADRFGKLPAEIERLIDISKIKLKAAAKKITHIEVIGQKITLTRNGTAITIDNRLPRLKSTSPAAKLLELLELLGTL